MSDTTKDGDPEANIAFGECIDALERGAEDVARRLMEDWPALAMDVAFFYANARCVAAPLPEKVRTFTEIIGDFELLHEIGRGGEGVVYQARQKSLQRIVAVKVMRRERFSSDHDVERFWRDSTSLASLCHPNIVEIYCAGESESGPYFAMELMTTGSLKQKLADGWLPTPKQAATLVSLLAGAIQCAHDQKIVHRDLKPANILLAPLPATSRDADLVDIGVPKVVDFGLAKKLDANYSITQSGAVVGTASYMAPEQANGQRVDFSCDIYGLGAILYELLTGRPPFVGATFMDTLNKVRHQEPMTVSQLSPTVPLDLEAICLKCLEKEPEKRYASARELAADLQRFIRDDPHDSVRARRPGITERIRRVIVRERFGRNTTSWGWAILLSGVFGLVGYLVQAWCIAIVSSEPLLRGAFITQQVLISIAFWWSFRGQRLSRGDRHGVVIMFAAIAGPALIMLLSTPPTETDPTAFRLSLYPYFAVVLAIVGCVQGSTAWGGNYIIGVGYLVVAVVMTLVPSASPILYGLYQFSHLVPLGVYMLRLQPSTQTRG